MSALTTPASHARDAHDGAGSTGASPSGGRNPRRSATDAGRAPLWMVSPAGLVMILVIGLPIVFLVLTSFTDYNQRSLFTGAYSVVGLEQYQKIFTDPDFYHALVLTLVFTVALVAGSVLIGVAVSEMMTRLGTGMRYLVTVVLIFAWGMPNVASSVVWKWMFQPGYGVVNWLLARLRIFGDTTNLSWSNNMWLALACIWMLVVWQAVPFIALTTYAAQSQVDPAYLEAARIDGAGEFRIYFAVTLPFLRPTLLLITILSVIWDFNVFNQIWLVTQGGPGTSTATLGVWTYLTAFTNFKLGTGAAISVVTTLVLTALSAVYVRRLLRSGEDL